MARKDRTGNRKTREQRKQFKVPELGYYLIVTDTEATERCFFTGLHQALPEDVRNKLVIKVVETKTRAMIDKCLELTAYDAQYRIPWIVFDRDQVQGFDEIIKEAEDKGIQVGWSNPCFEIWMYAYFGSMPAIQDSWACCSDFGRVYETKTGQKYSKADEQMYGKLCKAGDEEKAIQIAQQKLEQCKREGKTTSEEMLNGFVTVIENTFSSYNDSDEVLKLSSADERKNALYYYDLDELPEEMEMMKKVLSNSNELEIFSFTEDSLDEIVALITVIGNDEHRIVLYKQQYPISLLKRDKYMLTPVPHLNRLKKVESDILRIDFNFQFCLLENVIYVSDIDKMEKICSFHTLITNEARKSIEKISLVDILENVEVLEDELENVTFARKLTRVYKDSKVLGKVPNKTIVEFTKKHSYFQKNPIKSNGEKFVLDTKKSKEAFIKLMNDDFLKSELTNYEYESLAKNDTQAGV